MKASPRQLASVVSLLSARLQLSEEVGDMLFRAIADGLKENSQGDVELIVEELKENLHA
jgi:hypothetical protein